MKTEIIYSLLISSFIVSIILLITFPPMGRKFSLKIDHVNKRGMFDTFVTNYLGGIVYAKKRGANNIYISYNDTKNLYTDEGNDFNQYLVNMKDNNKKNSFFENLNQKMRQCRYNKQLYERFIFKSNNLLQIHDMTKDEFQFKPYLHKFADDFLKDYEDYYIIGIHYRGTDNKFWEEKDTKSFIKEIEDVVKNTNKSYKLLLVTIDKTIIDAINKSKFSKYVIRYDHNITIKDGSEYGNWITTNETGRQRGENVITDCLLLSKCDYIVKNISNISDVSLILNPHIPCTFIENKNSIYKKENNKYNFTKVN